jgi:putative serine/threonine protein kinase
MNYKKIKQLAKGWSSYIWTAQDENGEELVLKEVREKSPRKDLANREGKMLSLANTVGIGPKIIEVNYEKNFVAMEHIKGEKFFDWAMNEGNCKNKEFEKEVTKKELYNFIKELYRQCLALNSIGLSHNQLQIGKNILVKETIGKNFEKKFIPVIIDFEKATIKEPSNTKNEGQIFSMLFYNPNGAIAKKIREKMNLTL